MTVGRGEPLSRPHFVPRAVMGRKGIGKFSPFGIAREIEIETVSEGVTSRFVMNYDRIMKAGKEEKISFSNLEPTGNVSEGTLVTRDLQRYRTQAPRISQLRQGLARRFSVISPTFEVIVNGQPITMDERNLQTKLDLDADGKPYLWTYDNVEVQEGSGWTVSGWIGALDRTTQANDGIQRGVAVMARGKLVQEPWVFDATVGQQYALSYLIGELTAEFVDAEEDTIATAVTRSFGTRTPIEPSRTGVRRRSIGSRGNGRRNAVSTISGKWRRARFTSCSWRNRLGSKTSGRGKLRTGSYVRRWQLTRWPMTAPRNRSSACVSTISSLTPSSTWQTTSLTRRSTIRISSFVCSESGRSWKPAR